MITMTMTTYTENCYNRVTILAERYSNTLTVHLCGVSIHLFLAECCTRIFKLFSDLLEIPAVPEALITLKFHKNSLKKARILGAQIN